MNRNFLRSLLVIGFLLGFVAGSFAADKLQVVVTHETLKSLVETIGGPLVEVFTITRGTQDPHFIEAKPSFITKARRAKMWVRIGMEMEIGYERLILEGSRNGDIQVGGKGFLDASSGVMKLEVPTGPVDRSMGDVHPLGNPHYWLDPYNGRIMAREIADKLASLDPGNAATYGKNYQDFAGKLDRAMFGDAAVAAIGADALWAAANNGSLDALLKQKAVAAGGWVAQMAPVRGTEVITYHKSWSYFANRFGLTVPITLEPKPGIPPGPLHVAEVLNIVKQHGVKLILIEPYYDRAAGQLVSEKTGAKMVKLANSVGGSDAATDYISLINQIVNTVSTEAR